MAVLTPNTYCDLANALHLGVPAGDGDTITSIVNSGSDGGLATFTPSGVLPILRIDPNGGRSADLPVGATASYFALVNASAQLAWNRAHFVGYKLPAISNVAGITSHTIFTTTNNTDTFRCRASHTQAQTNAAGANGSAIQVLDALNAARAVEKYQPNGGGMIGGNGSPVDCCNILGMYFPTVGTRIAGILNGTDFVTNVAQTAQTGLTTNFNIMAHSTPNSFNMNGGKFYFYAGFTGLPSAVDMADTYAFYRGLYSLVPYLDWADPCWIWVSTSTPHGYISSAGRTHWQSGMITDAATNWPDGVPNYIFHFSPGSVHASLSSMWQNGILPEIPANAGRPVLWFSSAQASIGAGATGAAAFADIVSFIQTFQASFPQGYVILDTTMPTDGGGTIQAELAAFNVLLRAEFESAIFLSPHIYRGTSGGVFGVRAFLVDVNQNDYIGGPGNAAIPWANTAPTTFPPTVLDPTTAHNGKNSDQNHNSDTVTGSFGQTHYLNEYLPIVQYLMGPIAPDVAIGGGGGFLGRTKRRLFGR